MRIDEQHITEPGLVVLDVTATDENTIRAVMDSLQQRWATPASPRCGVPQERWA
ncbi:DUF6207 family protein [Streptomyces sp. NPDC057557]|uniref:DUF6207 family protein n=1 Tax=Streptomyces sp. NPDC057557 TaxID=3346167 RepID=UPI0036A6B7AA